MGDLLVDMWLAHAIRLLGDRGLGLTTVKVVFKTYIESGICVRGKGHSGFADDIFRPAILVAKCISDLITTPEKISPQGSNSAANGQEIVREC